MSAGAAAMRCMTRLLAAGACALLRLDEIQHIRSSFTSSGKHFGGCLVYSTQAEGSAINEHAQ